MVLAEQEGSKRMELKGSRVQKQKLQTKSERIRTFREFNSLGLNNFLPLRKVRFTLQLKY